MQKLLITGRIPEDGIKNLPKYFKVTYPEKVQLSNEDVLSIIEDYEIILACSVRADKNFFDKAKKLKFISNFGVGYDNVDLQCAAEHKVIVANTPTSVTEATAELAFGLMISAMRRITECDRNLRKIPDLKWGLMHNLGFTLYGKTLGIIGMGRIGKSIARRANAFKMNVLYFSRNKLDKKAESEYNAVYADKEELLKNSDVISMCIPHTKETLHFLSKNEFKLLKKDAFIINTARGPVIDEKILYEYLKEKKIAGAGLDVFENEPIIPKEFFELDNVVMTPHIGTASVSARTDMGLEASQNIIDYFIHKKPSNVVNPDVLKLQ